MAVYRYMALAEYVHGWTLFDGIREIIANGLDAEAQRKSPCVIRFAQGTLYVENQGVKMPPEALYFGGTSKRGGGGGLIGQFGEGLKLALLIFARLQIPVRVVNDDETWTPSFEKDANDLSSFVITTRSIKSRGMVSVEIPGLDDDAWYQIQQLFLRLMPPVEKIQTTKGTILLDQEYAGRRFSRGVFVDMVRDSKFGYDFIDLDIGRDRKSYRQDEATRRIGEMWAEAARDPDNAKACYNAMARGAGEFSGLEHMYTPGLSGKLLAVFREKHGENAYPVSSVGEGVQLEHSGMVPVSLPTSLCALVRSPLPSITTILQETRRKITKTYAVEDLEAREREIVRGLLEVGESLKIDVLPSVVDFKGATTEGLMRDGQVFLARSTLASFGKALGVYIHEAAHLDGSDDGTIGHVDNIHKLMEAALDLLWKRGVVRESKA
jgi:hypothetical protein